MISLQPLHLTHKPSGTWMRLCSTGCLGFLIFLNHAISISSVPRGGGGHGKRVAWIISPPEDTVKNCLAGLIGRFRHPRMLSTEQTRYTHGTWPDDACTLLASLLFSIT